MFKMNFGCENGRFANFLPVWMRTAYSVKVCYILLYSISGTFRKNVSHHSTQSDERNKIVQTLAPGSSTILSFEDENEIKKAVIIISQWHRVPLSLPLQTICVISGNWIMQTWTIHVCYRLLLSLSLSNSKRLSSKIVLLYSFVVWIKYFLPHDVIMNSISTSLISCHVRLFHIKFHLFTRSAMYTVCMSPGTMKPEESEKKRSVNVKIKNYSQFRFEYTSNVMYFDAEGRNSYQFPIRQAKKWFNSDLFPTKMPILQTLSRHSM